MPTTKAVTTGVTIPEAAKAVELSEDTVRRDLRRGAPHEKIDGIIRIDLEAYRAFREDSKLTGARGRPKPDDSPGLASAKLAKLEQEVRIKRAQADRDERRAEVDKGTHQSIENLREMLVTLGSTLRAGVDRMQRRFGPAVATEFNEILNDYDALVRSHVSRMVPAGDGGASNPASVHP